MVRKETDRTNNLMNGHLCLILLTIVIPTGNWRVFFLSLFFFSTFSSLKINKDGGLSRWLTGNQGGTRTHSCTDIYTLKYSHNTYTLTYVLVTDTLFQPCIYTRTIMFILKYTYSYLEQVSSSLAVDRAVPCEWIW